MHPLFPPWMVENRRRVVFVQLGIFCPKRRRLSSPVHTRYIQTIFHLLKQNRVCCSAVNTQLPYKKGDFDGCCGVYTVRRHGMFGLVLRRTNTTKKSLSATEGVVDNTSPFPRSVDTYGFAMVLCVHLNNVWFIGKHWLRVSVLIDGMENNAAAKKAAEAGAVIWSYPRSSNPAGNGR